MSIVLSREAWADGSAHRWLEERRTEAGVLELGEHRWAVVSHRAAMEVLTDAKRFTSRFGTGPHHVAPVPGRSLNLSDPPTPRPPSPARERVGVRVNQTAERLLNDDPRDWVTDFAQPLALQAFGDLFEVTSAEDLNELGRLTRALPRAPDVESFARADGELLEFLRARPTLLLTPGVASELTANDRLYLQRLFAQTGHESTAMAIALSLELLVTNALPFDPSPRAVNELLRLTSPLIRFGREATQATTVNGIDVPAGARLLVFFPLVNRDPAVFTDPHRIDLAREKNPHLSFGAGPHACYGADVARLVLSAALSAMSKRERPTRATGTPLISAVTRGLDSLLLR